MPGLGPNDPKMREREKKDTMTVAMGMKMTRVSMECWRNQINRETQIREDWIKTYTPSWTEKEKEILARVEERERQKKEKPQPPERALLYDGVSKDGKGRLAYLKARHQMTPKQKEDEPQTASQAVGWALSGTEPPPPNDLYNFGRKPVIKNGFYRGNGVNMNAKSGFY
jgi:hypothetical protein